MDSFTGCTYCGAKRFLPGPRGGACENITCTQCGARFNVVLRPAPGALPLLVDTLSPPTGVIDIE